MRDQLGARISSMEHVQKEFGHEIQKIKKERARLAKLVKPCTERRSGILRSLHSLQIDWILVYASVQVLNKASRLQVTRLIALTSGLHRAGQRATLKD